MFHSLTAAQATYGIAFLALAGVVVRPWRLPEAVWAIAGAAALIFAGLLPWGPAFAAVAKGADVYMFLLGMMLLSELARREGVFDYLAALCVRRSRGSAGRLFLLVYSLGTLVTVFMSNDATAVVLTPAVLAVCRQAKARPLPYLLSCAFIANAASFVLPISNPANLVIFGTGIPPLANWIKTFLLPSIVAIVVTYWVLRYLHRSELTNELAREVQLPNLSISGQLAVGAVVLTAGVLLGASALGKPLGSPTLLAACAGCVLTLVYKRESPWQVLRSVSWAVLALVAGLFVLVEGLERAGILRTLTELMQRIEASSTDSAGLVAGVAIAFAVNLMNNLPAGLMAGSVVAAAELNPVIHSAVVIGVDLGPNLSITGSLATILWLAAIRREGEAVSAWQFLRIGAIVMPAALAAALCTLLAEKAWLHWL